MATNSRRSISPLLILALGLGFASCNGTVPDLGNRTQEGNEGSTQEGRELFRTGTFGTEGYWEDAVGLGDGLVGSGFTLLDALSLGMQIDGNAIGGLGARIASELTTDLTVGNAPTLREPGRFVDALQRGAVVGLTVVDANGDQQLNIAAGDRVGITCALCHSVVNGADYAGGLAALPGAVGTRVDGPAPARLSVAGLFAEASNSRALLPFLPLSHGSIGGEPIGRTGAFASRSSTEVEVDALLRDEAVFPRGQWDMIPDGNGAPVVLPALYEIRRAGPYGAAGEFAEPTDAVNAHLTYGLDPTTLLTTPGTVFMDGLAPGIGEEIRTAFGGVLMDTNVPAPISGFPYVNAPVLGTPGTAAAPFGLRAEFRPLALVSAYLSDLTPMAREAGDPGAIARGGVIYQGECAPCHGSDPATGDLASVPLTALLGNYLPTTLIARSFPYADVLDDVLTNYDDRLVLFDHVFIENQVPAAGRTIPTPNLIGLHLRSRLLHDGSAASLDDLLDPSRGPGAPHSFYLEPQARMDLIEFLTKD